ncbi:single-stranded DNA-binding protein [Pseudoscardovia suis]
MSDPNTFTIIGRLGKDPEIRQAGQANVASFTVAYTPRRLNRQTNQWEDGTTMWLECQAWDRGKRMLATNVANGLRKGQRVIVTGTLTENDWTDRDGNTRRSLRLEVEGIGLDLTFPQQAQRQAAQWEAPPQAQPNHMQSQQDGGAVAFGGFGQHPDPWAQDGVF